MPWERNTVEGFAASNWCGITIGRSTLDRVFPPDEVLAEQFQGLAPPKGAFLIVQLFRMLERYSSVFGDVSTTPIGQSAP
jgi:hypothetical protein